MFVLSEQDKVFLDRVFSHHTPGHKHPEIYAEVMVHARALATAILTSSPPSRERGTAMQCLEEALMWANTAIARSDGDTELHSRRKSDYPSTEAPGG